jgi:hypothetical protein
VFSVISVYFNLRNILPKSGRFLLGHLYIYIYIYRRRWKDNIKMDLQEVEGGRGYCMELAQDRDRWRAPMDTVRDFRVPQIS